MSFKVSSSTSWPRRLWGVLVYGNFPEETADASISNSITTAKHSNQDTPSPDFPPIYENTSVSIVDYDGNIGVGKVGGFGAESLTGTGFLFSPYEGSAAAQESAEYSTDRRQEICFGMVRSKSRQFLRRFSYRPFRSAMWKLNFLIIHTFLTTHISPMSKDIASILTS
jgi:hypothetical protein